jgi:integrase/recombinase XerD
MASVKRIAAAVATILVREGAGHAQGKAIFKAARECAGLWAAPEHRGGVDRLTVEEEFRFLDRAYAQDGRTGLMLQTLLETGARASELVLLRVEDVSLVERVIIIRQGNGGKRREVPIRRDLAQLLRLHIGTRRAGPLFASRQEGSGPTPHVLTRQRVGQIVRAVAVAAGISKRVYPHLLRHTVATRLLALGMDITDLQRFLSHESIATTRLYAETTAATLQRRFDQLTDPAAHAPVSGIRQKRGTKQRCSPPTCSHVGGRSALPLLVHEDAALAIAKTGVDFPSRKRPPLSFLSSLGPLEGILQLPARLLVERERLRPILQRDLPENLDHGVQVLQRIERKSVVATGHEALRTAAILGWTGAAAPGADWTGFSNLRRQSVFDADLVAPRDVQVVLIDKPRILTEPQRRQRHVR